MGPLAPLADYRQWLPVLKVPLASGKVDKIPLHPATGVACDAHDAANWTDYASTAAWARQAGPQFGVGFVLTAAAGLWCVDIDGALQADRTWSPLALEVCAALTPGTAIEVSQSGTGLHLWGRGPIPPHGKKNVPLRLELYSDKRFILLGHPAQATGELAQSCPGIAAVVARYFPPRTTATHDVPDDGPRTGWAGPADDAELLAFMRRMRPSARATFEDGVTFADLFDANADALARRWPVGGRGDMLPYDASSADAALAQRLAWATGCHMARIDRMMRGSALTRDKWERSDYLPRTIQRACERQQDVLCMPAPTAQTEPAPAPPAATSAAAVAHPRYILADTPLDTARELVLHEFGGDRLKTWQGSFYRWRDGAWHEATDADIKSRVYGFIDAQHNNAFKPKQANVSNVMDALKHAPGVHVESFLSPPCWLAGEPVAPAADLVACTNGLLHLPTGTLHEATPRFFNLNALPLAYATSAPQPHAWLAFLAQVWPDDPEAIATLQEVFGYLLTPDTSQQKVFLIVGPKRSGKGTIARVLTAMLGAANVAGPTLGSLAGEFGLQPLVGKLAAIVSDARLGGRTDQQAVAENLLRLSGEDNVQVNRKNLPAVTLRLGVRFVVLTNELPKIADQSGALASRFIILPMSRSFFGHEDPGLTARLMLELPGVFRWALDGWHRLRARGYFVPPKSSDEAVQELADLGSPISAFMRDCCDDGAEVPVDLLFTTWRVWCSNQGINHAGTKAQFGRDLGAAFPGLKRGQPRKGNGRQPVYYGITLKPPMPPV
jgi:putative DNA primase/helicase